MDEHLRTLPSGFIHSCDVFADRPALEVQGRTLSYRELFEKAAALASTLSQWEKSECSSFTAVFACRSEVAFTGVLAALFSGHGYVPLNPCFPVERTRIMLKRAGCRRMVVGSEAEKQLGKILEGLEYPLVIVLPESDNVESFVKRYPTHTFLGTRDLLPAERGKTKVVSPSEVAYLLFTSGSTGIPKGVMVSHQNVLSFIDVMVERYQVNENDRFSQMFEMTFDLSVFDMFVAWERGACVCCPSKKQTLIPLKYIQDSNITIWFSVPSTGILMKGMGMLKPNNFPSLRLSLFCGEALPENLVSAWSEAVPQSIIENLYGPTELTIACTFYRWDSQISPSECLNGMVPIGEAYPGMSVFVVDEEFAEVRSGEAGELLMTGPQLSLGYWQDPEKTAAAFIKPPGKKDIFYRTGDRVRRPIDDGPLIYLGRMDNQIQVLGHRVELGEVEAVLREEAGTDLAVAVGWPVTIGGANGVVGFLKSPSKAVIDVLARMEIVLPGYMAPKQLYALDEFPLNSNGKVDRKALLNTLRDQL